MRFSLTISFILVSSIIQVKGSLFRRVVDLQSPDASYYYKLLYSTTTPNTITECASELLLKWQTNKALVFYFYNGVCQIGQIHPLSGYLLSGSEINRTLYAGYLYSEGCIANIDTLPADLYGLFIFTEDLFFYNVHRGFRANAVKPPVWSAYTFTTLSPVPTYSGKYAPLFDNSARTTITYDLVTPIDKLASFTALAWVYVTQGTKWNSFLTIYKTDSLGNPIWTSGFSCGLNYMNGWVSLTTLDNTGYEINTYSSRSALSANTWMYISCNYDQPSGAAKFSTNGVSYGNYNWNPGVVTFHSGLNQATIGQWSNYYLDQPLASVEFYLRSINITEIQKKMLKSKTYGTSTKCSP